MLSYPISIASYSFHGALGDGRANIFSYLEALKYRYHVDYADIWTGFLPTLDEKFLQNIRRSMDEREISLANLCVDGPYVWADEKDIRNAHKAMMLDYIKAAKILRAKTIRIDFGGSEGYTMSDEAFEYIVKTYIEYCEVCGSYGMKIGPENHWGWDRVPEYLVKVKEAVASPWYGHLFHFGNFFEDKAEEGIMAVLDHAMHTHIPANKLDFAGDYISRLISAGYKGTFSIEHHSGRHEFERVESQLGHVRSVISELTFQQ